jgi:anti-sigma factor RsiW
MTDRVRCIPGLREAVGAYALGALEPAEADQVAAHIAECDECGAQYVEFIELLPLLAAVTEQEAIDGPVRPEPAVLGRVLAAAEPPRPRAARYRLGPDRPARVAQRPRARLAMAAAGLVLVLGGAGAAVAVSTANHSAVVTAWSASGTAAPDPGVTAQAITASVRVTAADAGSAIELTMSHVPPGYNCSLVVVTKDGHREESSSWTAPSSGTLTFPDRVAAPPDKIASVQVVIPTGETLLTLAQ